MRRCVSVGVLPHQSYPRDEYLLSASEICIFISHYSLRSQRYATIPISRHLATKYLSPRIARNTISTRRHYGNNKRKISIRDFSFEYGISNTGNDRSIREKFEKFELPRVIMLRKREDELFRSVLAETCFFLSFSDAVRMRRYENANRFSDLANFLSSLSFCASFLLDIARSPNWKSTRARACAFTPRDSTPSS